MAVSNSLEEKRRLRIAIIYDKAIRPDTTGAYCHVALESLGHTVSHYPPQDVPAVPPIYDLYLRVDDDLECCLPDSLHPLVYWAIDTHGNYDRRLAVARGADFVFCAQRNGAERMLRDGIETAQWLPLACNPDVHHRLPNVAKQYDICFVGNTFPGDGQRTPLTNWVRERYARSFVGRAYGEEMARIYAASRLVFNCAIRDDINMRVFEAVACGSLLVTNDLAENGQNLLFTPGVHLATYRDADDLSATIDHYLSNEGEREGIAAAGMRHAHSHHTYRQRMMELLGAVTQGKSVGEKHPTEIREMDVVERDNLGAGEPTVSIIIPTFNNLALTQRCVTSIRQSTDVSYEVLIVDNGSKDGTAAWARGEGLRVLANPENLGFPKACNQGMLAADGDYLLLLNNDTLVAPGWLEGLLAHAKADPLVGAVGPSTNFAASIQQILASYTSVDEFRAFAQKLAREQAGQGQQVRRLVGLCLLIPRRVVQMIGLLDERFGLGNFEDDDYCLRLRMAGFRIVWAKDVFIHHEGHKSFRQLGEGFSRLLDENGSRFREKWDISRYLPLRDPVRREPRSSPDPALSANQASERAWMLLQTGHYADAYDVFEQVVRNEPHNSRALLGLGLAAEGRGVPIAAEHAYVALLDRTPDHPDARRGLERVRGMLGDVGGRNGHGTVAKADGSDAEPKKLDPPPGYYDHARPEVQALVPRSARRILDVGCAAGRLGAALKAEAPREVVGIELDPDQARRAGECLDQVLVGDVEAIQIPFPAGTFDCIICSDVLEHLRNPWGFLERLRDLLDPKGTLILSMPNVQFLQVLRDLAIGRWTYRSAGILDRGHLRFFTRPEICRSLRRAGFADVEWRRRTPEPLLKLLAQAGERPVDVVADRIRISGVRSEELADMLAVQFLIVARPAPDSVWDEDVEEGAATDFSISLAASAEPGQIGPPTREAGSTNLAWDLLHAGRYADAYDSFERLVQAEPRSPRAMLGLGFAAEGRGVPSAAELAYRTVLGLAPGDPDASQALLRLTEGRKENGHTRP